MSVVVNPGTERVPDGTETNARRGMELLVADLGPESSWDGRLEPGRLGWWTATIVLRGREHTIDMPGADPDVTRRGEPWVSSRIYVDGSSWLWGIALDVLAHDSDDE